MLVHLCSFLLPHIHNLNDIPSCLPFRLDLGYLCIEFCMRRSHHDCNGQRRHILRVEETVCDVVLHIRFPMENGGHYTVCFFYFTRVEFESKDVGKKATYFLSLISFGVCHTLVELCPYGRKPNLMGRDAVISL